MTDSAHVLTEAVKSPHVGGRNGWYRVSCSCGYSAWEAVPEPALRRAEAHKRDMERGLAGCSVPGCSWTSDNPQQHCPLHHREDSET